MNGATPAPSECEEERRRNLLLLRWVAIVATSSLLLFSEGRTSVALPALVLALLASNGLLHVLPREQLFRERTLAAVVLVDSGVTLAAVVGLGGIEPHVLALYFFVILLAAVGRSFRETLLAAATTAALALVLRREGLEHLMEARVLPSAPFIFCSGMFYAYLADQLRQDRERELEQARDAALEASRLKSAFLANMSHEIRTPLNVILGFAELLRERFREGGEEDRFPVEPIARAGRRLTETIHGILDISRIEVGAFELRPAALPVGDLIHRCVDEIELLAREKGLRLECRIDEPDAVVRFDEYCLSQALVNLLSNAVKFTNQGGIVVHLGRAPSGRLSLSVRDSGVGMAAEYLPRLFDAFSQEDPSSTRSFQGSGLGLALVKRYAEMNGAGLIVDSSKGHGSTFTIEFSADGELRPEPSADAPPPGRLRYSAP